MFLDVMPAKGCQPAEKIGKKRPAGAGQKL